MPPKKKAAGDAGKGEKVFKTLCAVCHSFTVTLSKNLYMYTRLMEQDPILPVL